VLRDPQLNVPIPDERQTVGQFLERWLEHKQSRLRPRAWLTYEQAVRLHLAPGLARIPLAKLMPAQLDRWFREHQENGASPRNIRYARTVLRAALNQARKWGMVAHNVAELVDPPRHVPREIRPLMPEEARQLLAAAADHRLGALVSVATALGLRLGEALGLRWCDVDFTAGTLSVRQALERSGGDVVVRRSLVQERRVILAAIAAAPRRSAVKRDARKALSELRVKWRAVRTMLRTTEPKSARSKRTVTLPNVVITALTRHRKWQLEERLAAGGAWEESGLVFVTSFGGPLDSRNVTREFRGLLASAKLPPIRFHDLRHTAATLLLAQGVDPRTIMETLGHSQIGLTLNTYSHVLPALQAAAAHKMDVALNGLAVSHGT
jgi:integrase